MDAKDLEAYLRDRIPLSAAMAVEVRAATPAGVQLYAPIAPNINHRDTVFGGSASALAILAAWAALHVRMTAEQMPGRIVIRRNAMSYERPIVAGFTATAAPPDAQSWARLCATLQKGRLARVNVSAHLECQGLRVGEFEGEFAVLPPEDRAARRSRSP
jgi:thioesterase domain-containing protein